MLLCPTIYQPPVGYRREASLVLFFSLSLFINDITDLFDQPATSILFADDIEIYSEIILPTDEIKFQNYLDAVHDWAKTWQIGVYHILNVTF